MQKENALRPVKHDASDLRSDFLKKTKIEDHALPFNPRCLKYVVSLKAVSDLSKFKILVM